MKIQSFDFSQFHNKVPETGSTRIRMRQMMKFWPEFTSYRYGDNPDVLIFQKVYVAPDYQFPVHFQGIKILDICDPDYMDGLTHLVETLNAMDAVTCPTDQFAIFLRQLTDKLVVVIPDRYDLDDFPAPKQHTGSAKQLLWFGYRHNAITLKPAMDLIEKCALDLLIISDDDPMAWQWLPRGLGDRFKHEHYTFVKWSDSVHNHMQGADFAILPKGNRPIDVFKSDNKRTRAILCGLPVATDAQELRDLIIPEKRREFLGKHYEQTRNEYDVRKSVSQYQDLIKSLYADKTRSDK